jgi:hypothetical protein
MKDYKEMPSIKIRVSAVKPITMTTSNIGFNVPTSVYVY